MADAGDLEQGTKLLGDILFKSDTYKDIWLSLKNDMFSSCIIGTLTLINIDVGR